MQRPAPADFVYLASASPRRRELLAQIGVSWRLLAADVDESRRDGESPAAYVTRLAFEKVNAALSRLPAGAAPAPVLGADTAVVVDGEFLGKPADERDAGRMLRLLSARVHEVFSAVTVVSAAGRTDAVSRTEVAFRPIEAAEIAAYWRSGEPCGKAGAYAIQGLGAVFVRDIRGSYTGVMGLPLFETAGLLARHGITVLGQSEPVR